MSDVPARAIRETLRLSLTARASAECLDAETLAAWHDGALSRRDRRTAERHAAGCLRCQSLLAAMARTSPAAPVRDRVWLSALAWLTPIATAAAAVLVWTATPAPRLQAPVPPARGLVAVPPPALPGEPATAERAAPRPLPPKRLEAAGKARGELDRVQQPASRAPEPERQPASPPAPLVARDAAAPPPAAAAAPPMAAPAESRRDFLQVQSFAKAAAALNDVASPDTRVRWRFSRDGRIEHTADGGITWQTQARGLGTLTAGIAPSATACWMVGDNGTVLRSVDGASWEHVAFPEPVNLTAVRASDALNATVVAADRRTFTTHDGGRTWQTP